MNLISKLKYLLTQLKGILTEDGNAVFDHIILRKFNNDSLSLYEREREDRKFRHFLMSWIS